MELSVSELQFEKIKYEGIQAAVAYQGKLTIAAIDVDGHIGIGIAACMPSDKYSKEIGVGIATARAIKFLSEQLERTWVERAVTKKEWAKKHKKE